MLPGKGRNWQCPYPRPVEDIITEEYPALAGKAYLDHAGSQPPPKSLIEAFSKDLQSNLYGNPHSESDPAAIAGHKIDAIRDQTLRFFGADPKEYDLIFVANATAGLKLVGEVFRDYVNCLNSSGGSKRRFGRLFGGQKKTFQYLYHKDAHNSVVGIRSFAENIKVFVKDEEVENWIHGKSLSSSVSCTAGDMSSDISLFAYPGQSNLTGRRLPLHWSKTIRKSWLSNRTYTLLDAAALATTKRLQISDWKPDFVCLSMYKIFGFPDLGALLVRKETGGPLFNSRRYFGGGTVEMVLPFDPPWVSKKDGSIHEAAEDGTLPFHNIMALGHALESIERIYGSIENISMHTRALTRELHDSLISLQHQNGLPVVRILKDANTHFGDSRTQGATVSFLVFEADGTFVPSRKVEKAANAHNVYLRTGSMCNPGGISTYLSWTSAELKAAFDRGHKCSDPHEEELGRPVGVVRASLGACSSRRDVEMLVKFLREEYVERPMSNGHNQTNSVHLPLRRHFTCNRCGFHKPTSALLAEQPNYININDSAMETFLPVSPDLRGSSHINDRSHGKLMDSPWRPSVKTQISRFDIYIASDGMFTTSSPTSPRISSNGRSGYFSAKATPRPPISAGSISQSPSHFKSGMNGTLGRNTAMTSIASVLRSSSAVEQPGSMGVPGIAQPLPPPRQTSSAMPQAHAIVGKVRSHCQTQEAALLRVTTNSF